MPGDLPVAASMKSLQVQKLPRISCLCHSPFLPPSRDFYRDLSASDRAPLATCWLAFCPWGKIFGRLEGTGSEFL